MTVPYSVCLYCGTTLRVPNETGICKKCFELSFHLGATETDPKAPTGSRKDQPLFSGVLMYFPDALLAVSEHSKRGNDKHNPGERLHWAPGKSTDHADCIARHLVDIGPNWDAVDPELGTMHAAALAWRALALLQIVLNRSKDLSGGGHICQTGAAVCVCGKRKA